MGSHLMLIIGFKVGHQKRVQHRQVLWASSQCKVLNQGMWFGPKTEHSIFTQTNTVELQSTRPPASFSHFVSIVTRHVYLLSRCRSIHYKKE